MYSYPSLSVLSTVSALPLLSYSDQWEIYTDALKLIPLGKAFNVRTSLVLCTAVLTSHEANTTEHCFFKFSSKALDIILFVSTHCAQRVPRYGK